MKRIRLIAAALCAVTTLSGFTDRKDYETNLLKEAVASSDASSNVVVSPRSAGEALSMLAEGAGGSTRDEIIATLGDSLYGRIPEVKGITLKSANSVWIRKDLDLKKAYARTLCRKYDAQAYRRSFSAPETVGQINLWCSKHTNGKIPSIIERISPESVLFLINAIYFNANWDNPFDEAKTREDVFHGAQDLNRKFMHAKKWYDYMETDKSQIVVLPYAGGRFAMTVILPKEGCEQEYEVDYTQLRQEQIRLSLPKFKVETTLVMNDILKNMGIRRAFYAGADFSRITSAPVAVDKVLQKCYIDVSEKGTEAAAVTMIEMRLTAVGPGYDTSKVMNVNRPFVFKITDLNTGEVLFAGRISDPKQN